jgi:putative photosynthetic complex assembly protein
MTNVVASTDPQSSKIRYGEAMNRGFPRVLLFGAAALLTFVIGVTWLARISGVGVVSLTPAAVIESRDLKFLDLPDGGVSVVDVDLGREIAAFSTKSHGFIRVLMRDLAQARKAAGIGAEPPFRLSQRADGQAILQDTATGRVIILNAFGGANAAAFTQLLPSRSRLK